MSPRFAKELRPLVWPWCVAALAGAGHLVALANPVFAKGEFGSFLTGLAGVAFVVGVLVLVALPIGSELNDRTFVMLLSQPADRLRLWRDKFLVSILAVLGLAVVHGLACAVTASLSVSEAVLYAAFVVTAICSVGFYTLGLRSMLTGIAVAAGTPFAIAGSFFLIVYYVFGIRAELSEQATVALIVSACAVYSAVLVWLSRRQFLELELNDGPISRAAEIPETLIPRKLTEIFRARPAGAVANLIRKEIGLQKPTFLVSAVFVVCWLLTLLLMPLRPAWHDELVGTLYGLTGAQMVLMTILTGCVSLGDDKSLGTMAWHLTLPISTRQQWFIKLLVAAATLFAMAVLLPTILSALTLFKVKVGLLLLASHDKMTLLFLAGGVFIISFWSASMMTNTVRAALATMFALMAIPACVFVGAGLSQRFLIPWPSGFHNLQSGFVTTLIAHFQLVPSFFERHPMTSAVSIVLVILAAASIALRQSLNQSRRDDFSKRAALKSAAVLAAVIIVGSFWSRDWINSIDQSAWQLPRELDVALETYLRQSPDLAEGHEAVSVTPQQLEQTGQLSGNLKTWLRGTQITVQKARLEGRYYRPRIELTFPGGQLPDGRRFGFDSGVRYSTP